MKKFTLTKCGFYFAIYDLTSYFDPNSPTSGKPVLYTEWNSPKVSVSDLGYKSDCEEDEKAASDDEVNRLKMLRELSASEIHSAISQQLIDVQAEKEGCIFCIHIRDEIGVSILSKASVFSKNELYLSSFFAQLLINLEANSLMLVPALKNMTSNAATSHILQSLLSFIMTETFNMWSESHGLQSRRTSRTGTMDSQRSAISHYDHTGNWLIQSGYYDLWGRRQQSSDMFSELMNLIDTCELEIQTIKRGYTEFLRGKNTVVIPVEDWDLRDGSEEDSGDEIVPTAMSEHQMLEHLVQQAQIVELKLDRLELLSLREARTVPNSEHFVEEIEHALMKQRNALHHLKSSFIIATDELIDRTSSLVLRNSPGSPSGSQMPLVQPSSPKEKRRQRRKIKSSKCCTIL